VSISAALLPRLSAHAAEGRLEMVAADTARGVRLTGSMFMAFGGLLMVPLFAWGASDVSSAQFMGVVLAAFSVGLLPYSSGHFQLRSFYALQDTRTPAMSNLWGRVVNITVAITVASVATNSSVTVIGLALSTALGYWVTFIVVWARLAKRLNGVDTKGTIGTLLRSTVASVIALIPGLAVALPIWWNFGDIQLQIMAGVAGGLGCAVTGVVYLLLAPKFRLDEVHGLATSMLGRVIKR
jgi:putative peptidoglycan lipid II flippase